MNAKTKPAVRFFSRRVVLLGSAATTVAGCTPFGADYGTIKKALAVSLGLEEPPKITIKQASEVPYASIAVAIGNTAERMLVLATSQGEDDFWTSSARIALTTRAGRVISTAGLPWDLSGTQLLSPDPLASQNSPRRQVTVERLMDFKDVKKFSTRVTGTFEFVKTVKINILGTDLRVIAAQEKCSCQELDWAFTNVFWMDEGTGLVWRSIQHTHPNLAPISISILRPPG